LKQLKKATEKRRGAKSMKIKCFRGLGGIGSPGYGFETMKDGDSKPPRSQRARETERAYEHMAKSFVVIEIEQSTSCTAKRGWMGKNKSCHWGSEHKINVQQS